MNSKPFKMKYTNGRKADPSSFPFHGVQTKPGNSPADFNWKAALGGAGKGAAAGSMIGPWGTVIGGLAGGLMAGFKTPEEEAAASSGGSKSVHTISGTPPKPTPRINKNKAFV